MTLRASNSIVPVNVIQPRRGWQLFDLAELRGYHELLLMLALRDIKVRYKQTIFGASWALLQPLMTMVVFTWLFQLLGRIPADTGSVPYPVSTFCALLPWQLFANSVTQSSNSLVTNQQLITKVYFPRVLVPAAPVLSGLVDFGVAFLVLIGMMAWYGITPTWHVLFVPVFLAITIMAAFALGLWFCTLNTLYRDFRYVVPFAIQLFFFVSPVVFETNSLIPEAWRTVYSLNPMVVILEGFRWALLGKPLPSVMPMVVSALVVTVILMTGLVYFRRMERVFTDRV